MNEITLVEELVETVSPGMGEEQFEDLLDETKERVDQVKKAMIYVSANLIRMRDSGEWERYGHKTFPKFVQMEIGISQGQTSRLQTIGDCFLGEYTPEDVGAISERVLYAAARLPGKNVQEKLAKAKTWSDDDFKQNTNDINPHPFQEVSYCGFAGCGLSKERHPEYAKETAD